MLVETILRTKGAEVVTIAPDTTVTAAATLLAERRIGAIVVTDAKGGVIGILSERDIVIAVGTRGARALDQHVADLMARKVETCGRGDTISHVMTVMTARRVRHLPVVEDGRLIGIVSIGDVVKSRIEETEHEAQSLRDYVLAGH
jgi:CBS domain-containing protein